MQSCLQGLLLRENGYNCEAGVLYFAESQERVTIPFTGELIARTLELLTEARRTAEAGQIPPPHKNIELRRRQFQVAENQKLCLYLARAFVSGKIRNSRTLLRRNGRDLKDSDPPVG